MASKKGVRHVEGEEGELCSAKRSKTDFLPEPSRAAPNSDDADLDCFGKLSNEVILEIFRKLPKTDLCSVFLVCQRFSTIAETNTFWERVSISNRLLLPETFIALIRRQVKYLKIYNCRLLSAILLDNSDRLESDCQWCLNSLELTRVVMSFDSLIAILTKCPQLTELVLNRRVNDKVLETIATNNQKLEVFTTAFGKKVSSESLESLLKASIKLRVLKVWRFHFVNPGVMEGLCGNLPRSLQVLDLSTFTSTLADRHVAQIVENCPHLVKLDLSYSIITGEALRKLSELNELRRLTLNRCSNISRESFVYLNRIKSLEYFDLAWCAIADDMVFPEFHKIKEVPYAIFVRDLN